MEKRTRLIGRPNALRKRRLQAFLTVEELSEASGVKVPTIRKHEANRAGIHLSVVRKLAAALGCDPSAISEVASEPEEQAS